jgi:hypothetical protein
MADDEIDERLSRRFGGEENATREQEQEEEEASEVGSSNTDMSSQQSESDSASQRAQKSEKAQNIKKEWNVRSFYLDHDLNGDLSTAFKRLDFELSEAGADLDLKKTRHFYPLIVRLGLERLESMDITEVQEELEGEDSV